MQQHGSHGPEPSWTPRPPGAESMSQTLNHLPPGSAISSPMRMTLARAVNEQSGSQALTTRVPTAPSPLQQEAGGLAHGYGAVEEDESVMLGDSARFDSAQAESIAAAGALAVSMLAERPPTAGALPPDAGGSSSSSGGEGVQAATGVGMHGSSSCSRLNEADAAVPDASPSAAASREVMTKRLSSSVNVRIGSMDSVMIGPSKEPSRPGTSSTAAQHAAAGHDAVQLNVEALPAGGAAFETLTPRLEAEAAGPSGASRPGTGSALSNATSRPGTPGAALDDTASRPGTAAAVSNAASRPGTSSALAGAPSCPGTGAALQHAMSRPASASAISNAASRPGTGPALANNATSRPGTGAASLASTAGRPESGNAMAELLPPPPPRPRPATGASEGPRPGSASPAFLKMLSRPTTGTTTPNSAGTLPATAEDAASTTAATAQPDTLPHSLPEHPEPSSHAAAGGDDDYPPGVAAETAASMGDEVEVPAAPDSLGGREAEAARLPDEFEPLSSEPDSDLGSDLDADDADDAGALHGTGRTLTDEAGALMASVQQLQSLLDKTPVDDSDDGDGGDGSSSDGGGQQAGGVTALDAVAALDQRLSDLGYDDDFSQEDSDSDAEVEPLSTAALDHLRKGTVGAGS